MSSSACNPMTAKSRFNRSARYVLSCMILLAAMFILSPSSAYATCSNPNPWFQPTTVEKGDLVLVTGTGIGPGQWFIFTFTHQTAYPLLQIKYMTKSANSNCVVNQEYVDTTNFKKGNWTVEAVVFNGDGGPPGPGFSLGTLTINPRTTPAPIYPMSNCGQTAHAWFGPSIANSNQNMFVAAVARPDTVATFFFEPVDPPISPPVVFTLDPAHSNCVADDKQFLVSRYFGHATFNVHAGFWDEFGHYNYVSLGTFTVN
jgi:hypothetical protein